MNPTVTIAADRATLRLSDTVTVTVTVTGKAPLRIDTPTDTFAGESAGVWRTLGVSGPHPKVLPNGDEQLTLSYQLSPYRPGDSLPLEFAPFLVKSGAATEPVRLPDYAGRDKDQRLRFKVETSLLGARAEDARPATVAEDVPAPPPDPIAWPVVWALSFGAVPVMVALVVALLRRRNRVPELSPTARAVVDLRAAGEPPSLERVAAVVRRFLNGRFGFPAETTTTAELLSLLRGRTGWSAEEVAELGSILAICDQAKFAAGPPDAEAAAANRDRARAWVQAIGGAG